MIRYLLDTNTCIYLIRKKPTRLLRKLQRKQVSEIGISSITLSELEYGAAKSTRPEQNKLALIQFLAPIAILPYNDRAALGHGRVRAHLARKGTPIGSLDLLIAAHALSLECVQVSNNESEFKRIPDLKVDNWTQ